MAQKAALFEQKIADVNKGPEYERVDHGPNFKPGWKHSGNSGGGKIILILIWSAVIRNSILIASPRAHWTWWEVQEANKESRN